MVLGDSPFVAETPAHLLDNDVTPVEYLFVRNNGLPPAQDTIDAAKWTLLIDGESVENPTQLTLDGLKSKFKAVTQHLALESPSSPTCLYRVNAKLGGARGDVGPCYLSDIGSPFAPSHKERRHKSEPRTSPRE